MTYEIWIMISEEMMNRNNLLSLTRNWLFAPESKWPFSTNPNRIKDTKPLNYLLCNIIIIYISVNN